VIGAFDVLEHGQLRDLLTREGFEVEYQTAFMSPLLPAMWARRRLLGRYGRKSVDTVLDHEFSVPWAVGAVFNEILRPEARWVRARRRLPIGTSLLAVAQPRCPR
jgi:hypothetical protein